MQKAPVEGLGPRTPTAVDEGPPSPTRWSSLNADDAAYSTGVDVEGPADWTDTVPSAAAPARSAADTSGLLGPVQVCVSVEMFTCLGCHCCGLSSVDILMHGKLALVLLRAARRHEAPVISECFRAMR
jgi:hypothetical protein